MMTIYQIGNRKKNPMKVYLSGDAVCSIQSGLYVALLFVISLWHAKEWSYGFIPIHIILKSRYYIIIFPLTLAIYTL